MRKQEGFTKKEVEQHPDYAKEQTEALNNVKELLAALNAKDYRERINEIFFAFLTTEEADYKPTREAMITLHFELVNFFTKMKQLPLIDRHRN